MTEFKDDVETVINAALDEIELNSIDGPAMLNPEVVVGMVVPKLLTKIEQDPEQTKRIIARLHLESGALLEKHDERSPESILK